MASDWIDDGYTETFWIEAEPGVHDQLGGNQRPLLQLARDRVNAHVLRDPPNYEAFGDAMIKELATAIKAWTLKDSAGNLVPISAATVRRVKPRLLDKLWGIVTGQRASDRSENGRPDLEADAKN